MAPSGLHRLQKETKPTLQRLRILAPELTWRAVQYAFGSFRYVGTDAEGKETLVYASAHPTGEEDESFFILWHVKTPDGRVTPWFDYTLARKPPKKLRESR